MAYFEKSILLAFVLMCVTTGYAQTVVGVPPEEDTTTFARVEVEASYPGGLNAWRKFLERSKALKKTAETASKMRGIQRKVYTVVVQFIVDSDGSLSKVRALTQHGFGLEEGAVKVIQESGKWYPAMQSGRPVKAYRNQPISFVFQ